MSLTPYYQDSYATLYCGDCRSILPQLGKFDLVLTDPPYGIGYVPYQQNAIERDSIIGDFKEFDPSHLVSLDAEKVIWGGNNFAAKLPFGGWLCWDKRTNEAADKCIGSPFELAWSSKKTLFKIARIQHGGAVNADGVGIKRVHPTQKPVSLMVWCLSFFPEAEVTLDAYSGSGTTLIAAKRLGRKSVGIEICEEYCEISAKRLELETTLFDLAEQRQDQQQELGCFGIKQDGGAE